MNILLFVAEYWHDFLVGIILIAIAIVSIQQWIKVKGPIFNAMTAKEKIAYITRLLTNLVPIALVLVTDAEITFGGKTGPLKRSYVIDELYKRIPDEYKKYITEENLDAIINKVLPEAQELWMEDAFEILNLNNNLREEY
jgi:hypothetical protein